PSCGCTCSEEPGDVLLQGGERDAARPVDADRGDGAAGQQLVELAAGDGQRLGCLGHGQQEPGHGWPPSGGSGGGAPDLMTSPDSGVMGGWPCPANRQWARTSVVSSSGSGQRLPVGAWSRWCWARSARSAPKVVE